MIDKKIVDIIESAGIDMVLSLPCNMLSGIMDEITLRNIKTCACVQRRGRYWYCRRCGPCREKTDDPDAEFRTGENCVNALMSLTTLYEMPLLILMSPQGEERANRLSAQKPMGKSRTINP